MPSIPSRRPILSGFPLTFASVLAAASAAAFATARPAASAAPARSSAVGTARAATSEDRPPYTAEQLGTVRRIKDLDISPDGCLLAFASDLSGSLELWTVAACSSDGAPAASPSWPEQLSYLGERVTDIRFSPDGSKIVFAADEGGNERRDLYWVPARGGTVERLTRTAMAETNPVFSPDGKSIAYIADPERPFLFQLFVMDLETRQSRQLTHETVSLLDPVWSRDGRMIAATRSGDWQKGNLLIVRASSGVVAQVEPPTPDGILFAQDYAPDGNSVLVRAKNKAGFMQLGLVPAGGGAVRFIGPGDWDVEEARWNQKAGIVFTVNENGRGALYRLASATSRPEAMLQPGGQISDVSLSRSGNRIAYSQEDTTHPAEAWVLDVPTRRRARLTRSLAAGVEPEHLSQGTMISYPSFDGATIHALYYAPRTDALGTPPPVVVWIHGGPNGQAVEDFNPLRLLLTEAGFAVLAPNYRGSTGYGKAFEDLDNMDWGGGDLQDLIAGVRHLAGRGLADAKRAGITGGSFGGYLTLMALAKSSDVWAAGVEAYGVTDLVNDYDLVKDRFGDWYQTEMGTPQSKPELFKDRSPVNFLDNIRAPLLMFQGANDANVPRAESDQLYAKLLDRRLPVGLIIYPNEGHGFTHRRNRIDYYRRTMEFFQKYLAPRPAAVDVQ